MKQKKTKQANRWHVHVCLLFAGLNLAWASLRAAEDRVYYEVDDYLDVEKIDAHFHIRIVDSSFVAEAAKEGFRFQCRSPCLRSCGLPATASGRLCSEKRIPTESK